MTFVPCTSAAGLAEGAMAPVEAEGRKLLVAKVGGTIYAMQRKCPHMGFDLSKGTLEGTIVTCRMHKAQFDLKTGEAVAKAKLLFLKTQPKPAEVYAVKVEGDQVLVDV